MLAQIVDVLAPMRPYVLCPFVLVPYVGFRTRCANFQLQSKMAHYISMRELTANNYYQRNCVDLKLVPIIRIVFQFGIG